MSFVEGDAIIKLALGKGKTAKSRFSLVPLQDVVEKLRNIDKDISLKYQAKALKKAAKPGLDALRQQVGKLGSVTGNLAESVARRDRKYTNNRRGIPVSVEVVGFRRPTGVGSQSTAKRAFPGGSVLKGPNRAYHSHLVEFGTAGRRTPGKSRSVKRRRVILDGRIVTQRDRIKELPKTRGILSSLKTRGPFFAGGRGLYPFDFIATGSVAPMPALRPLQKAFTQARPSMQSILDQEMRKALTLAIREVQRRRNDEFPYS